MHHPAKPTRPTLDGFASIVRIMRRFGRSLMCDMENLVFTKLAAALPFILAGSANASEPSHQEVPIVASAGQATWQTHDAGRFRILTPSADTSGRYSLLELVELPGYKTPPHKHPGMDETFYVLEGTLELRVAGKTHRLAAGSYVHIPRDTPHAQGSADDKPVRLLVTLSPGEFESFFLDRAALTAKTPRGHEDFQRLYLEIIRKHSRWLQPASLEPAPEAPSTTSKGEAH